MMTKHRRVRVRVSEDQAWVIARDRFGDDLAPWVRLERIDMGWLARVEEPPIGPGDVIGRPILAVGPTADDVHFHPPMTAAQVGRAHQSWLAATDRHDANYDGPMSFA